MGEEEMTPSINNLQGKWIVWDDHTQTNVVTFEGNRYSLKYSVKRWYYNPFGFAFGNEIKGTFYIENMSLFMRKKEYAGSLLSEIGGPFTKVPANLLLQVADFMAKDERKVISMSKDRITFANGETWKRLTT